MPNGTHDEGPSLVVLVRHADIEGAPGADPPLSEMGMLRAKELLRIVGTIKAVGGEVLSLYASDARRTQATLQPLAEALHLPITISDPTKTAALTASVLGAHGGVAIVAGHSNTIPPLIHSLRGPGDIVIRETEFNRLFLLTGAGSGAAVMVELKYGR